MAEQWSSKSHVWVRFLLPLLLRYYKFKKKLNLQIYNYWFKLSQAGVKSLRKTPNNRILRSLSVIINNKKSLNFQFKRNWKHARLKHLEKLSITPFKYNYFIFQLYSLNKNFQSLLIFWKIFSISTTLYWNFEFLSIFLIFFFNLLKKNLTFLKKFNANLPRLSPKLHIYCFFYLNKNFYLNSTLPWSLLFSKQINSKLHNFPNLTTQNHFRNSPINTQKIKPRSARPLKIVKNLWKPTKLTSILGAKLLVNLKKKYFFFKFLSTLNYKILLKNLVTKPNSLNSERKILFFLYASLNYYLMSLFSKRLYSVEKSMLFLPMSAEYTGRKSFYITKHSANADKKHFWFKPLANNNKKFLAIPSCALITNNFLAANSYFESNFFFISLRLRVPKSQALLHSFNNNLSIFNSKFAIRAQTFVFETSSTLLFTNMFKPAVVKKNWSRTYGKLTGIEIILILFSQPLYFKYLYFKYNKKSLNYSHWNYYFKTLYFYSITQQAFYNNLLPSNKFSYVLKKRVSKSFNHTRFIAEIDTLFHHSITRFLEFCSGKKSCFQVYSFLNNDLTFHERMQCFLWSQKVKYFRKVLGPRLFLNESLQIIYLSLKLKDPYILSNWIVATMYKISFWKYKTYLRYLKYVLRYFFWVIFKQLKMKGIKYQLKGKISVAGNARTRTAFHYVGFTSHGTFNNRILHTLNLVRTFTGVLGLKVWLVF